MDHISILYHRRKTFVVKRAPLLRSSGSVYHNGQIGHHTVLNKTGNESPHLNPHLLTLSMKMKQRIVSVTGRRTPSGASDAGKGCCPFTFFRTPKNRAVPNDTYPPAHVVRTKQMLPPDDPPNVSHNGTYHFATRSTKLTWPCRRGGELGRRL